MTGSSVARGQLSTVPLGARVRVEAPEIVVGRYAGTVLSQTADTIRLQSSNGELAIPVRRVTAAAISRGTSRHSPRAWRPMASRAPPIADRSRPIAIRVVALAASTTPTAWYTPGIRSARGAATAAVRNGSTRRKATLRRRITGSRCMAVVRWSDFSKGHLAEGTRHDELRHQASCHRRVRRG